MIIVQSSVQSKSPWQAAQPTMPEHGQNAPYYAEDLEGIRTGPWNSFDEREFPVYLRTGIGYTNCIETRLLDFQ